MMKVEKCSNLGYSVGCTELDTLPKRVDLERFINYVGLTAAKEVPHSYLMRLKGTHHNS